MSNYTPKDRGIPGRRVSGGTRAKEDQKTNPPNPLNPEDGDRKRP